MRLLLRNATYVSQKIRTISAPACPRRVPQRRSCCLQQSELLEIGSATRRATTEGCSRRLILCVPVRRRQQQARRKDRHRLPQIGRQEACRQGTNRAANCFLAGES